MTAHSELLTRYRRMREVRLQLNNVLVGTIPKRALQECGRRLGYLRKNTLVFDSEDDMAVLMDYCLYDPGRDGRTLVTAFLEKSPPPAGSAELVALQQMTHAYYSIFQITDVERGVGVSVQDLLREETGFIVDIGFGNTARRHLMLASRIIPMEGFLMTGGAGLPVDLLAARRITNELKRMKQTPETFDFHQITPRQEADLAALIIRTCRSSRASSHIAYAEPGSSTRPVSGVSATVRTGRNEPCPCGSGKKFKMCCGRC
jgi:SEC-C motif